MTVVMLKLLNVITRIEENRRGTHLGSKIKKSSLMRKKEEPIRHPKRSYPEVC